MHVHFQMNTWHFRLNTTSIIAKYMSRYLHIYTSPNSGKGWTQNFLPQIYRCNIVGLIFRRLIEKSFGKIKKSCYAMQGGIPIILFSRYIQVDLDKCPKLKWIFKMKEKKKWKKNDILFTFVKNILPTATSCLKW